MSNFFFIDDSTENRISYYHLLFFMLSLPFDRLYSSIILISLLIHTLIFFRKSKWKQIDRSILLLQSVFFVTALASLYGYSPATVFNELQKQLAIFLFPLIFVFSDPGMVKHRLKLLDGFTAGCTLTICWLFFDAVHVLMYNHLPLKNIFTPAFLHHNFSSPIEIHATYLSMMLAVAIVHSIRNLMTVRGNKSLNITCTIILLAGLLQLGSKISLTVVVLIVNLGFFRMIKEKRKRLLFILAAFGISCLVIILIFSVTAFHDRFIVSLKDDLHEHLEVAEAHGRLERWHVTTELIKESPIIGHGTGSEIPLLRQAYYEHKMYDAYLASLNAHNQYLGLMISSGAIGLLVYVIVLLWGLLEMIRRRDITALTFIVVIIAVSFTEDILEVNKGIFFYAFFFSFFMLPKSGNRTDKYPAAGNH